MDRCRYHMYDGMCEVIDAALVESGKIGEISMGAVFAWDGVFFEDLYHTFDHRPLGDELLVFD